jgi:hypothetical protein
MTSYDYNYHTYPIHAEELFTEGAFKRFTTFPTPQDVYNYALMGVPKVFPLTQESIPLDLATNALESAVTEIEMEMGMSLSPVTKKYSEDYVDGAFSNNFMGIKLPGWPATKIIQMQLKFPHTNTPSTYQRYTIPPGWIYLKKNNVNVVAAMGSITVGVDNESLVSAGGIFTYITGFARGAYAPGTIEIVYQCGWDHDKLPSNIADLIKTWAAHRMLPDLIPILAPNSGVSVSIDGVAQSTQYNLAQLLTQRVQMLEQKKKEIMASIVKSFGKTIKFSRVGS